MMAAGTLAAPGTAYGPCADECSHIDCAETRAMAETLCRICNQKIGYDRRFYRQDDGLVHASCLEEDIEREQKERLDRALAVVRQVAERYEQLEA